MTVAYRPSGTRSFRCRQILTAATALGSVAACFNLNPAHKAHAQFRPQQIQLNPGRTSSPDEPATFQADKVDYDDNEHTVTWSGNVQMWQGDHVMRADKVVYDRDTGVVAARGHVASIQPDGSVIYAHYAELTGAMRDGIMMHVNVVLPENGKLAANGMRRTGGKVNDMSRAVYTACAICEKDRSRAPFWQFRAFNATQDIEHETIDFRDSYLDILGIPVLYLPYFSITDPSAKRHSGFLMPGITPHDRYLGTYFTIPYYWVIDDQSDLTVQGLFSTKTNPQLSAKYRNRFNFGYLNLQGGIAYSSLRSDSYTNDFGNHVDGGHGHGMQGYIFANTQVSISKYWRAGANINLATSADYMRNYRIQGYGADTLSSNVYLEGFGTGSYSRVDAQYYQGLNQGVISNSDLPFVLPRYTYSFVGQPDALGGRFSLNTTDFNVIRDNGTSDMRGQMALNWDRPFRNRLGQQFLLTLHLDSMVYRARKLYQQPNYYTTTRSNTSGQVLPTIALKTNWPFVRTFEHGRGSQLIEPIVQAIYAPNTGAGANNFMPNEDSLAYEFTDSTLFSLNRYQGTDRLDGGLRGNVGVHANWTWDGHEVDLLAGESFQEHITHDRLPYSGLDHAASDIVMRGRVSPNQYFNFTARMRLDPYTTKVNFGDALFSAGVRHFRIRGGYVYEPVTPYYYYVSNYRSNGPVPLYSQKTNELSGGVSSDWDNWHVSAFARRSLSRKEFVSLGGDLGYNNDCFGIDVMYLKQYTTIGGQQRNSSVLFTVSLKTLGSFGLK
ncbi:LPS-assembly protein LptD [Acetobacter orientalis]|uniref:LPS-assembly protein LptD n=1 Tax=Acetobacter orientalis TaxID=146474 RepID=UPI002683FE50